MDPVRARLAAQRLSPGVQAADPVEAARAVCGVQAQDVRSAGLALRSRVMGLTRAQVDGSGLVRTWTVRGTLHLIAPDDRPWLHALCAPRFLPRMQRALEKRGHAGTALAMLDDLLELIGDGPLERSELLDALARRSHPELTGGAVNVLMPWVALQGLAAGTPDGRWVRADPPEPVDEEQALATLGRRYLEGYGPAGQRDLAAWSGLPLGRAKLALELSGPVDRGRRRPSPRSAPSWRRSTPRCWAGRRVSRSCRRSGIARCCPAAACCARWSCAAKGWWAPGAGAARSR